MKSEHKNPPVRQVFQIYISKLKFLSLLISIFLLSSCNRETIDEINLSKYFNGIGGTAVFYNPQNSQYKIYNIPLSRKQSSPCSTFKIMSAYIALSEHIITKESSNIAWNGKDYQNQNWNKDINLHDAFRTSCVWYFRTLTNKIPPKTIISYLKKYNYGNQDISDWQGHQNSNTDITELKGFWIESSLQISPLEQTKVLAQIFSEQTKVTETLKDLMLITDTPIKIYGKTGLGIKDDLVNDAWFVGFYEQDEHKIFFAVRLNDKENPIKNYRRQASTYAKQITLDIIRNAKIF